MFTEKYAEPLFIITDDTGMIQHSNFTVPDPKSGYTTDDNARALMAAVMLYERYRSEKYLELIFRYLSFLTYAQNKDGGFKNFMDYNRNFIEENGSEDCFGRCLWCLGCVINSPYIKNTIKYAALTLVKNSIQNVYKLNHIRGKSYSLIGLCIIYKSVCENSSILNYFNLNNKLDEIKNLIINLSDDILHDFKKCSSEKWQWFEDELTYSNSIIPLSLLKGYETTKKDNYLNTALKSIDFLNGIYFKNDYFKPIGCKGWFKMGANSPAEFDEQPVEACSTAFLYLEAYKVTNKNFYLRKAHLCSEWFTGNNSIGKSMLDNLTHGCYDGIRKSDINLNTGAESILANIITQLLVS